MPIRMGQVADAAGCSARTQGAVFRGVGETMPLSALHMVRLDQALIMPGGGAAGGSMAKMARRYGFANPSRFAIADRRCLSEVPSDPVWRSQRSPAPSRRA